MDDERRMELLEHLRRQRLAGRDLWTPSIPKFLEKCLHRVMLDLGWSRGTKSHRLTFTEVALLLQEITTLYCYRVDDLHLLTRHFLSQHLDGSHSDDLQLHGIQYLDNNATLTNPRDGDRQTSKNGTTRGDHHKLTISACRRPTSEEDEMQPLDDLTSSADLMLPPNQLQLHRSTMPLTVKQKTKVVALVSPEVSPECQCREMLPIMPLVLLGIDPGRFAGLKAFWVNSSCTVASGCLFLGAIPTDPPFWIPTVPTSLCSSPTPSPSLSTSPCVSFPPSSTSTPLSMKSSTTTDTTDMNCSDEIEDLGVCTEEEDAEDAEPHDTTSVLPMETSYSYHIEFESFDHLTPCPFVDMPSFDERVGTMMDLASFDSENEFFISDHQDFWVNCSTPQKDGTLILSPTLFIQGGCRPRPFHLASPMLPNVQDQGLPLVKGSGSPTSDLTEHDPVDSGVWSDPLVSFSIQEQEQEVEVEGNGESCGSALRVDIYDDEWVDRLRHWQNRVAAHLEKSRESPCLASIIEQLWETLSVGPEREVGVTCVTRSFRSLVLGETPQYAASTFLAAMHLATAGKLEIEKTRPNDFSLKLALSAGLSRGYGKRRSRFAETGDAMAGSPDRGNTIRSEKVRRLDLLNGPSASCSEL